MKKLLLLLSALIVLLVSCEDVNPVDENKGSILVSPEELVFDMDGGDEVISVVLNSVKDGWTLVQTEGSDWCVPARKSGKTSTSFKISVSANASAPRSVTLEFAAAGCQSAYLKIDQKGIASEAMPSGLEHGINYNQDGSVTFVFLDEDKNGNHHDYAYLIGEFNDWKPSDSYLMKRDDASGCWWYTLSGVSATKEYMFQYYLGNMNEKGRAFADPYSEIIYESYDRYIASSTYPDLRPYPAGTSGAVSAFQITRDEYAWEIEDYLIEDEDDLVIYELHFRDFTTTGDINGAMQKLDYLENLGVNAIELMPIQEFSGSDSWGYNPIAYFALEKSYGTRKMYKEFIDECHKRGIAVLVDVVYNHVHEDHAMAGLYFDWTNYKPTADNPWFNIDAPHPYGVFHDWNHESAVVRNHVKRSLKYLIEEYKVDGFRFDLTKGFTNKSSNESTASNYDASRVAILKDYGSFVKGVDQNAVVILEHFADTENKDLGNAGLKVWRNVNGEGRSSVHGSAGNYSNLLTEKGIPFGTYVGFFESHDEERMFFDAVKKDEKSVAWGICGTLTSWGNKPDITMEEDGPFFVAKDVDFAADDMFKIRGNSSWDNAYNYGASKKGYKLPVDTGYVLTLGSSSQDMAVPSAGRYDVYFCPQVLTVWLMTPGTRPEEPAIDDEDAFEVALRRSGAAAAFLLTVPGPKMIWQFGELGYDVSINDGDRTGRKPVRWEYYEDPLRKNLYDTYSSVIKFRRDNPEFFEQDAEFSWTPAATVKTTTCTADGKTFHLVGNFGKVKASVTLPEGQWYDYMNGNTAVESGTLSLKQGEFKLLTDF